MANIGSVQAAVAYISTETAGGQEESGRTDLHRADTERKQLQQEIKEKQAKIQELQKELEGATDDAKSFGGKIKSLWGDDSGVGKLGDQLQKTSAEMKKEMRTLEQKQVEMEAMLKELQQAQQELGGHLQEHRKTNSENDRTSSF